MSEPLTDSLTDQIKKGAILCYHCGADCGTDVVMHDEKPFCCNGCKTVYQILSQQQLCDYYQIDGAQGIKPENFDENKFSYLDDPEVLPRIADFLDSKKAVVTFYMPQIHCASCIWLLEKSPNFDKGIHSAKTDYLKKQVRVIFDPNQTTLRKVVVLLASLGYEPAIALSDKEEQRKRTQRHRRLYFQVGVAGFCFGNVMLLALPDYFDFLNEMSFGFKQVFAWLSFALSIPVLLFSSADYLVSALKSLRAKTVNLDVPLAIGIVTLFVVSAFEVATGVGQGYFDSFTGLVFLLLVGRTFQSRTFDALSFERDYTAYLPLAAEVINNEGKSVYTPVNKVEKGMQIRIRKGEIIPCDGTLASGPGFIDYSFITGESEPTVVGVGERIFSGGRQTLDPIIIDVDKKVEAGHFTKIWNNPAFARENNKDLSVMVDNWGKWFTVVVFLVAVAGLAIWLPNVGKAFQVFTGVLIVACPCALAVSIPFAYGNAMRYMARSRFYLKNVQVVERLAQIDSIVFDKTGTLTNPLVSSISYTGIPLSEADMGYIAGTTQASTHPLSRRIADWASTLPTQPNLVEEQTGAGVQAFFNDTEVRVGRHDFVRNAPLDTFTQKSGTVVHLSIGSNYYGYFLISQNLRSQIDGMVKTLSPNYQISVASGDMPRDQQRLESVLGENTPMHFNMQPEQKLDYIKSLQDKGLKPLMLGDGLNDVGALRQAHVGIALTENTTRFSPACDALMHASAFDRLSRFLAFSKATLKVVYWAFGISAAYNITGLAFALSGKLIPVVAAILMPISSVTIVLVVMAATAYFARKFKI